jgi:hypothetical protein
MYSSIYKEMYIYICSLADIRRDNLEKIVLDPLFELVQIWQKNAFQKACVEFVRYCKQFTQRNCILTLMWKFQLKVNVKSHSLSVAQIVKNLPQLKNVSPWQKIGDIAVPEEH